MSYNPVCRFLCAGKSNGQNRQNYLTPWGLTLTQTYLIFVDNLDLWLTMSSSKSAFSDKSATWSLNSWKSIVKSPSLCPLLTRTFEAFGARYFIKGYCQLFECGLICGTSPLERPKQQFQHFFKLCFNLKKIIQKSYFCHIHYGPSMMSQGKTPWKDPPGVFSIFCGGISHEKAP